MRLIDRNNYAMEQFWGGLQEDQINGRYVQSVADSAQTLKKVTDKEDMCELVEKARSGDREAFGELVHTRMGHHMEM